MKAIELDTEQLNFIKYLESKGKSFNTIKNYKTDLNCFNKYILAHRPELKITELTHTQAKEYSRFLIKTYNSPNSIRRRVQALRIFFDYLIENNKIDENPVKQVVVAPKVIEAPKPASFKDILKLNDHILEGIKTKTGLEKLLFLRNKVLLTLIYSTGLKVSDISKLKRSNILQNAQGELRVLLVPPKRDPISIPIPAEANELFENYSKLLEEQKTKDSIDFDNLFFNSNPYSILAGNISPRGIEILFKDFSKKLDFKMTAKSLRQAAIIRWIIEDKAESTVKEWMGVQPNYSLKSYIEQAKSADSHYLELSFNFSNDD